MKRIFTTFIFFAINTGQAVAQSGPVSPLFHLFNYPGDVAAISWDNEKYLEPDDANLKESSQSLIRNKNGLFVALPGTGRLYKTLKENDRVVFQRLDSTVHTGDNFDSFIFSFRDTIYSLGGYGNWKVKGILRFYVEQKHEWEIMRLNQEIPIRAEYLHDLIWYDQKNGKIYFCITNEINSTTTEPTGKLLNSAWVLDLVNKEWKKLGSLSTFIKDNLVGITNIISSPFGQFATLKTKNVFIDYSENRIYRLSDAKQRELELLPTNSGDLHVNYFIDSLFFSWLTKRNLGDSVSISRNDLILLDENVYEKMPAILQEPTQAESSTGKWLLAAVLAAGAFLLGLYFGKGKKEFKGIKSNNEIASFITFTSMEIDIIHCISENSRNGNYTSIEEVNRALGVSKKNPEIQKKQRSDIITAINKKFSYIKRQEIELIEKRRTEFDKRSFEYFIDSARIMDALQIIKENSPAIGS